MKITDGEKLILLMLSELYDKLSVDGEIDSDFIRSAIFHDKTWSIPFEYPSIPFENKKIPDIVKEVLDILDMWSLIEYSYGKLKDEDKADLEKEAKSFEKDPKFQGFDGNQETDYMGTASFIVNQLDRFEKFKGRNFNSHSPRLDVYRRMFSVFKKIRDNTSFEPSLNAQQLAEILKEIVHPDHR